MMRHGLPLLLALSVAPLACSSEELIDPVPSTSTLTDTTSSTDTGTGGEGGAPPAKVIRTVEQRSPFGNVAATDNLLFDGDFEWSSPFSDQYGWFYGPPYSYSFPAATIGAACRSGVKCVTLPKNKAVIGIGVGSGESPVTVTAHARPENAACEDVDVSLLDIATFAKDVTIPAVSEAPGADGWCEYSALVPAYPQRVYLLIDNNTAKDLVVDDVVVRAAPGGGSGPTPPPPVTAPPTAERVGRRDAAREAISRLRGPIVPPNDPAKRALQEHLSR
ncbi:MAG: hypothetical protein R3B70_27990 [Polyangiaceae bacterium]